MEEERLQRLTPDMVLQVLDSWAQHTWRIDRRHSVSGREPSAEEDCLNKTC